MNPDRWLTSKRLRAHGLLLALTIWSLYLWTLATPTLRDRNGNLKGTDFLHFYTLGSLALTHRGGDLYNINAQAALAAELTPDAQGIRYLPLYPPQVSILFAPMAHLPYGWALAFWWVGTAAIYAVCCYAIWRICPNLSGLGGTVALLAIAFPAFFHLIAWGQASALALACFTAAYFLLLHKRKFSAGLVLGCLAFKPQLALGAAVVFLAIGEWKAVSGAVLSGGVQVWSGVLYYGWEPFRSWIRMLLHLPEMLSSFEPKPYQTHCLRTFWSMIVPWNGLSFALYVVSAAAILAWTVTVWKHRQSLPVRYSTLLLATVLVSPHLTVYDLVILAPAFLLLTDRLMSHRFAPRGFGILLYLLYVLPLLGPFTRWIHIQLSVVAMVALLYLIRKFTRTEDSELPGRVALAGSASR